MGAVFLVDGVSDRQRLESRVKHRHGVAPDLKADGTPDSVRIPFDNTPVSCPRFHKARVIRRMALALAAAITGDVLEHLRVPGGELVDLLDHCHRLRRLVRDPRKGREWPHVRLHRGNWDDLGSGGGTRPKVRLKPALAGRDQNHGPDQTGGGDGDQLVNHGFPIVTDSR